MKLRNTIHNAQERLHRTGLRSPRSNHNSGTASPLAPTPAAMSTDHVDHVTPQAAAEAITRAPSPAENAPVQALTPPSPVLKPIPTAEATPPPGSPQCKYVNARALLSATDTWVEAVEHSKNLSEVNDTLSRAQEDLEKVHERLRPQTPSAAKRIVEAAIERASASFEAGVNEADVDEFKTLTAAMGAAVLPADLEANLLVTSLIGRTGDSFETCAATLMRVAQAAGGEPASDEAKTARKALVTNIAAWVELAPSKLPMGLPFQMKPLTDAAEVLSTQIRVDFEVELDMPSEADNLKLAEDLWKQDMQGATGDDEELAQRLQDEDFNDW